MITKDLSRKQITVSISLGNSNKFMVLSNKHISNIGRVLKDIKLDVLADFIWADNKSLTITTNDIMSLSRLQKVDLVSLLSFLLILIFFSNHFLLFLFLELRVRVKITQLYQSQWQRWSQVMRCIKGHKKFWKGWYHTTHDTHGHLG